MERQYSILYKPHHGKIGDPILSMTVSANPGLDIWNRARRLGFVLRIVDLSLGGATVFSIKWDFNLIGVDQAIIDKENLK